MPVILGICPERAFLYRPLVSRVSHAANDVLTWTSIPLVVIDGADHTLEESVATLIDVLQDAN